MTVHLQTAQFLEACTADGVLSVLAIVGERGVSLASDGAELARFKLATLREPLQPRRFATLDAAFAFCRQAVPELSDVRLSFRVI